MSHHSPPQRQYVEQTNAITLAEEYALNPEKRPDLVKTIPEGSADYFLYRLRLFSQHLQDPNKEITTERIDEATAFLEVAEHAPTFRGKRELLDQFKCQFALLGFKVRPDLLLNQVSFNKSSVTQLDYAATAITTTTDDAGGETLGDIRDSLSSTMDQDMIKTEVLVKSLLEDLSKKPNDTRVHAAAWPFLMAQPEMESILLSLVPEALLNVFKSLHLPISAKSLEIIGQADTSRVDQIVVKVILRLYEAKKLDFRDGLTQFMYLTCAQLGMIQQTEPSLINNEGFVGLLEKRMIPRPTVEYEVKEASEVRREWLDQMVAFVDKLSPKFNRNKLSVYLMSLEYDLAKGTMDKDKFMRYVAIPRTHFVGQKSAPAEKNVDSVDMSNPAALHYWSKRVQLITKPRDEEIQMEYLTYFITREKSIASFEEFFAVEDFLNPILARAMLTSGDKDVATWSKILSAADGCLTTLTERTMVKFARDNPSTFLPDDPVVFKLKVKNAKRVIVRVFEVKTLEYLQQHEGVVGKALILDGLSPNWEHTFSFDHYPPIEIHEVPIELPELANRRGAFVMDVICNGENSSAYFTKGYLDYIERQSIAGHVLTIIDEQQKKITEDVGVWFNGYFYKTSDSGDVVIPYKAPNGTVTATEIFITHNDFATRRPFSHYREDYTMELSCHVDQESLVAGSVAKVMIKPTVYIAAGNIVCPVELLEQAVLQVVSTDSSDTKSTKTILDFKVFDDDLSAYNFQVPENLLSVEFTFTAKVKVLGTSEYQELSQSKSFTIDSNDSDQTINVQFKDRKQQVQLHGEIITMLRKTAEGYQIHVMGKNGEKRPNIPLDVVFTHTIWTKELTKYLLTDADGIIHLGPLNDIESVFCGISRNKWHIVGYNRGSFPNVIQSIAGEPIFLPLVRQDACFVRSVSLFKKSIEGSGTDWCLTQDYTRNVRLKDGLLTITHLVPGYYRLKISDEHSTEITVASTKASQPHIQNLDDYHVGVNPMLEVPDSAKHPLHMLPAVADDTTETVKIRVRNGTSATRVCILATRFIPWTPMFEDLVVGEMMDPWRKAKTEMTLTNYTTGRILGEEYQYVLNRKAQTSRWAGNLLNKPSVLLAPWSIADTAMSRQAMAHADTRNVTHRVESVGVACSESAPGTGGRGGAARHRRFLPPGLPPLLTFLSHPSVLLINLVPDQNSGRLSVPYAQFKECSFLQIFVTDAHQALQQSLSILPLAAIAFQKRDLRFKSPLDHTKHYISERSGTSLDPKIGSSLRSDGNYDPHSITLTSNGSSSSAIRVVNSISQVYDLMVTLTEGSKDKQNLRKFGFVTDWHRLSISEKNEKFSKWNCHELNLFLYKKDRLYFDQVVKPFIKNKLVKSFVDEFLIGASLERYTSLTEFNLLTCMEKCLLSQSVPRVKSSVAKWIRSRVRNTRVASDVKLFRTVMGSGEEETIPSSPVYSATSLAYSATSPKQAYDFPDEVMAVGTGALAVDAVGHHASGAGHAASGALEKVDGVWKRTVQVLTIRKAHVDKVAPIAETSYVYYDEEVYDSVLVEKSTGITYVTQLLFDTKVQKYYVYVRWGETDYKLDGPHDTIESAKSAFQVTYKERFGLEWETRETTVSEQWTYEVKTYETYEEIEYVEEIVEEEEVAQIIIKHEKEIIVSEDVVVSEETTTTTTEEVSVEHITETTEVVVEEKDHKEKITEIVIETGKTIETAAPKSSSWFKKAVGGAVAVGAGAVAVAGGAVVAGAGAVRAGALTVGAAFNAGYGSARSAAPPPPPASMQQRTQSHQMQQQQFRPVDLTKEMAETYYWERLDYQASKLKDVNAFWLDFVQWDETKGGAFLSDNFVSNTATFTDAMATLALLDVTFKPKKASIRRSLDCNLIVTSPSPAIVFHSSTKELLQIPLTGSMIATQQYFKKLEKTVYNSKLATNVRSYIRPGAEFRPLESYGAHVVLINATPNAMKLHLAVQLPQGAMPLGILECGQDVQLTGHGTFQYEYGFYFPAEGDFDHYPAHISDSEDIIAFATPTVLKVRVQEPSLTMETVDTTTWSHVITRGSNDEVLAKLGTENSLEALPVETLIPRLYRDVGFLKNVTKVLRERHEYIDRIWSVCLALTDRDAELDDLLREYIENQSVAIKVGPWFTSKLLTTRPQSRYRKTQVSTIQYLEYFPLINARAHRATRTAKILNDRFKTQFDRFLDFLSCQPNHGVGDLLVMIVYLLAQDRILEAKEQFVKLSTLVQRQGWDQDPQTKSFQRLQYDYLQCYLSLCVEVQSTTSDTANFGLESIENLVLDLEGVLSILNKYRSYPVKRWNKLFRDMRHYVDEILKDCLEAVGDSSSSAEVTTTTIESKDKDETEQEKEDGSCPADSAAVTMDFKILTDSQIEIRHQGVREVIVEYYAIDAETMFSSSPLTFSDQGESGTNNVASGAKIAGGKDASSSNSYKLVKPNGVDKHVIEGKKDRLLTVPVLERYLNTNVMISVSTVPAAATKSWRAYYSQTIDVQCNERLGTIKVLVKAPKNGSVARPIRGGYIKVYAEMKQGWWNTSFWKDGYTDLVGRFEYAQVSTGTANGGALADVRRFVVFVDGGKEGCLVKTMPVPAM